MRIRINIHLVATLSMSFWAFSFILSKIVFKYYEPVTTIFLRLLISSLFLLLLVLLWKKKERIKRKHVGLFMLSAVLNPFFYFLGENFGLKFVSSTLSAVIITTIPVFTPIASYFMLKEKLTFFNLIGLLFSFFGIMLILVNKDFSFQAEVKGVVFLFAAVAAAIFYGIYLKKLSNHYSSVTIITCQNLLGTLYFLPLFLIMDYPKFIQIRPNFELLFALISLAIFASSIAFILFTSTIRKIGLNKGNIYTNLIPVITGIAAYFILGETYSFSQICGMIIVILGVFISQINRLNKHMLSKPVN